MKLLNRSIFSLSLIGLLVSAFLAYEYSRPEGITCPITGAGCDIVRNSAYSSMLGIQIPYYGIAFYLFVALLSILLTNSFKKPIMYKLRLVVILFGFIFGVYLTFLEAFVIKAFCFWCVVSFIISGFLLVFAILEYKKYVTKLKQ
ncbi:hypothetical protein A3B42_01520 [Candidatus Daviesbacteria bacterium RIFCSPLOWO2_01_FULL_38_10]|uniref:Vitamin K epoxide reductase domain-containing protein n=1 Tax=Candidatus Daviesbacteria bacterium GW2011_GWF2_38_6 TaxID=1618432 RepID=A0A0G0KBD5_9BACT|nr:MAG: hypothetical protein US80_C0019G0004 [Candidatus Daviesbacteria bacterium GW2011_GWA2_38_17]KKQ76978.1 MAG: hypothetical protein US99_C0053G0007 [Candidatus Daviesbacteria bacterium GW2011_GWF2_38_6]OGE25838.1 MAG: hypothetical protein A3D02_04430 [Candidatus Daviesbacteria bacterium RIFCSPHIGHO2_02_FULL_39_41]OGE36932.1 MAG: hypothetical protein A3B42_01520 [Candidatus Daviesbacteria bacterium RIFCSPLOWO2_01_FULL_38_10]OGE45611.1 MAG: hypothetical protein A3E67_01950 [Candidatus Davies